MPEESEGQKRSAGCAYTLVCHKVVRIGVRHAEGLSDGPHGIQLVLASELLAN